jgi:hypothetical protein
MRDRLSLNLVNDTQAPADGSCGGGFAVGSFGADHRHWGACGHSTSAVANFVQPLPSRRREGAEEGR